MNGVKDLWCSSAVWLPSTQTLVNVNNPLISYCCDRMMQAVKKLLFEVTEHDTLDSNGDTPLHCFVKRKDREKFNCLIIFLIHSKCDVNLLNKDGQTALHLACQVKYEYTAVVPFQFPLLLQLFVVDIQVQLLCQSHHNNIISCC